MISTYVYCIYCSYYSDVYVRQYERGFSRYGDRAPKSIPARIFGLLWMFAGIVLMSLFTAALSASLTADTQKVFALKGAKVMHCFFRGGG